MASTLSVVSPLLIKWKPVFILFIYFFEKFDLGIGEEWLFS